MKSSDITVVILTQNEAARLPAALASVPAGAQIFVLDADSVDATVAIAQAAGAVVERRAWAGFVNARRHALGRVTTPWTLMLDADEALDTTLAQSIIDAPDTVEAYYLRRTTTFCGRRIRTAGWSNEKLVRLFRTHRIRLEAHSVGGGADLHERWVCDGSTATLAGAIVHDSYPTVASYAEKFARYTEIEAASVTGSPANLFGASILGCARFAWALVRYSGWRDGWRGAFIAASSAAYPIVIELKALRRK